MKKVFEKFGYVNMALLFASTVIILKYVDFQERSTFSNVLLALYGITISIHEARLMFIIKVR